MPVLFFVLFFFYIICILKLWRCITELNLLVKIQAYTQGAMCAHCIHIFQVKLFPYFGSDRKKKLVRWNCQHFRISLTNTFQPTENVRGATLQNTFPLMHPSRVPPASPSCTSTCTVYVLLLNECNETSVSVYSRGSIYCIENYLFGCTECVFCLFVSLVFSLFL